MRLEQIASDIDTCIASALDTLESAGDQVLRARLAEHLAERMRQGLEEFADQRTAALGALRDDGWSLADMMSEFGGTRQRISQVINRETYKEARKARGRT